MIATNLFSRGCHCESGIILPGFRQRRVNRAFGQALKAQFGFKLALASRAEGVAILDPFFGEAVVVEQTLFFEAGEHSLQRSWGVALAFQVAGHLQDRTISKAQ